MGAGKYLEFRRRSQQCHYIRWKCRWWLGSLFDYISSSSGYVFKYLFTCTSSSFQRSYSGIINAWLAKFYDSYCVSSSIQSTSKLLYNILRSYINYNTICEIDHVFVLNLNTCQYHFCKCSCLIIAKMKSESIWHVSKWYERRKYISRLKFTRNLFIFDLKKKKKKLMKEGKFIFSFFHRKIPKFVYIYFCK